MLVIPSSKDGVRGFPLNVVLRGCRARNSKGQKEWGKYFENLVTPLLLEMGMRVIDTEGWGYRYKKGGDKTVAIKGARCGIEFKFDRMSEKTGNVVVDLDSINKTTSAIWI